MKPLVVKSIINPMSINLNYIFCTVPSSVPRQVMMLLPQLCSLDRLETSIEDALPRPPLPLVGQMVSRSQVNESGKPRALAYTRTENNAMLVGV